MTDMHPSSFYVVEDGHPVDEEDEEELEEMQGEEWLGRKPSALSSFSNHNSHHSEKHSKEQRLSSKDALLDDLAGACQPGSENPMNAGSPLLCFHPGRFSRIAARFLILA